MYDQQSNGVKRPPTLSLPLRRRSATILVRIVTTRGWNRRRRVVHRRHQRVECANAEPGTPSCPPRYPRRPRQRPRRRPLPTSRWPSCPRVRECPRSCVPSPRHGRTEWRRGARPRASSPRTAWRRGRSPAAPLREPSQPRLGRGDRGRASAAPAHELERVAERLRRADASFLIADGLRFPIQRLLKALREPLGRPFPPSPAPLPPRTSRSPPPAPASSPPTASTPLRAW